MVMLQLFRSIFVVYGLSLAVLILTFDNAVYGREMDTFYLLSRS